MSGFPAFLAPSWTALNDRTSDRLIKLLPQLVDHMFGAGHLEGTGFFDVELGHDAVGVHEDRHRQHAGGKISYAGGNGGFATARSAPRGDSGFRDCDDANSGLGREEGCDVAS